MKTPETTKKAFGVLIQERRKRLGISQEELAARAGLDRTYLSGLERGKRNPSLTAIAQVAFGFETTVGNLLKGLEEKASQLGSANG